MYCCCSTCNCSVRGGESSGGTVNYRVQDQEQENSIMVSALWHVISWGVNCHYSGPEIPSSCRDDPETCGVCEGLMTKQPLTSMAPELKSVLSFLTIHRKQITPEQEHVEEAQSCNKLEEEDKKIMNLPHS